MGNGVTPKAKAKSSSKANGGKSGSARGRGRKAAAPSTPGSTAFDTLSGKATAAASTNGKSKQTVKIYTGVIKKLRAWCLAFERNERAKDLAQRARQQSDLPDHEIDPSADDDPHDSNAATTMDPEFPFALDGPPKKCTPDAILLYMWDKCGEGGCGKATADKIQSAVAWHYETMDGDLYRKEWSKDPVSGTWTGNPARSARVKSMHSVIKNLHGERERTHSRAMSFNDMTAMHQYRAKRLLELEGKTDLTSQRARADLIEFGAASASAWLIWLRNSELTKLQVKDVDLSPPEKTDINGKVQPHLVISVCERKNWTRKQQADQSLTGHVYHIYERKDQPGIDAYTLLHEWMKVYEDLLGRKLQPDDLLFPSINASLSINPKQPLSDETVRNTINETAEKAGLPGAGAYTTHCFRRGGAQYRFMYAPLNERWTLSRIRWWGGWAAGEKGDTLVRYLLDELFTYEEDHRDALRPNDCGGTSDLKGAEEAPGSLPLSSAEGRELVGELRELCRQNQQTIISLSAELRMLQRPSYSSIAMPQPDVGGETPGTLVLHASDSFELGPVRSEKYFSSRPYSPYRNALPLAHAQRWCGQAGESASTVTFSVPPQPCTPYDSTLGFEDSLRASQTCFRAPNNFSPITEPSSTTAQANVVHPMHGKVALPPLSRSRDQFPLVVDIIVKDWDGLSPERCPVPLRDWTRSMCAGQSEVIKWTQRRRVALEFIDMYRRDKVAFNAAYPEYQQGLSALHSAILLKQQERGDAKTRAKRV